MLHFMKFVMIATLAAQKTNGIQQVVFISVIKFQLHRMPIATSYTTFSCKFEDGVDLLLPSPRSSI